MQVQDIMTPNPTCAEPTMSLQDVARIMVDCDCGGVPVCQSGTTQLVGFLTDRDIVCRILAQGMNPLDYTAQDAMTTNLYTIAPTASVDNCIQLMERHRIRRVPVTDEQGNVLGIVSQADIARFALQTQPDLAEEFEEALEEISQPKMAM